MSPVVQKGDKFSLDKAEQAKLFLIWLSSNDFRKLNDINNKDLLKVAWGSLKNDLYLCFKKHQTTLNMIIGAFRKIHLTVNPKISMQYDSELNTLDYHLWDLFFSLCQDNSFIIPIPSWKLGGELVHEFDHYLFLKEHDMIGKDKSESDKFKERHQVEIEKRAYLQQIAFLENSRNNVPTSILTYKINELHWKNDGSLTDLKIPITRLSRKDVLISIDQTIHGYSTVLKEIESGKNYDNSVDENNVKTHSEMAKIMSLSIKLDAKKKDYPKMEMEM